jgi:D-glycero-alpha-D-manno-heptose 1-phosphate guanylyltransferase
MIKEAIILAGGLGTRLKAVISEMPKSMAPVNGKPFLEHLFDYLFNYGIGRIVIAAGYRHKDISSHFGNSYRGMEIAYSIEEEPLGTGGALLHASRFVLEDNCLVLNGDTCFNVDLNDFRREFSEAKSVLSLALKPMKSFERYGSVRVDNEKIKSFEEKKYCSSGLINGGIYLLDIAWLKKTAPGKKFSFETDIMEKYVTSEKITYFISDTYFIDIGIPEDYLEADKELPRFRS